MLNVGYFILPATIDFIIVRLCVCAFVWHLHDIVYSTCLYFRVETDEYRLKLSDVNLLLGEVGLESDQYEQAILDIHSSLQLRQFVLQQNDRRIAEV